MYEDIFVANNLPSKLSHEKLIKFLEEAKNGNLDARNVVITHNIKLVLNIVYKKYYAYYDKKELVSIGLVGLIKAVDKFDYAKGFKFSSFATKCIENELFMYFRKKEKDKQVLSLETIISNESDTEGLLLEDTIYNENDNVMEYYEKKETIIYIQEILNELNERDKKIIMLNFGFYDRIYNQKEIALIFNLSQPYINRLIRKTLLRLKDRIEIDKNIEKINILCRNK